MNEPWNWLPPDLMTKFIETPGFIASAPFDAVVICASSKLP